MDAEYEAMKQEKAILQAAISCLQGLSKSVDLLLWLRDECLRHAKWLRKQARKFADSRMWEEAERYLTQAEEHEKSARKFAKDAKKGMLTHAQSETNQSKS